VEAAIFGRITAVSGGIHGRSKKMKKNEDFLHFFIDLQAGSILK
jgi:hypothetical protein